MSKEFKIQIPTEIVRSSSINAKQFVLLAKLIQLHYLSGKKLSFRFNYKVMMNHIKIKDNKTFKETLNSLCDCGYIFTRIDELPRKENIDVVLNPNIIPKKDVNFTQLTKNVLDISVINVVSHVGVRLLYYYKSYINSKEYNKQFAYPSEEVTASDIGLTEKTVIKYNKKLEKNKFVKIERHNISHDNEYIRVGDREMLYFTKYQNHYFIREDKVDDHVLKNLDMTGFFT